jgi:regulator of protease activity HflC (stomatin/prohibitin superfamily)
VNTIKDTLTGLDKSIKSVQVVIGPDGKVARASESSIKEYGITVSPVTINDINYEGPVKAQIAERQKSTQAVQLSQAAAIRATQDAITTEQQGKANAAKAKWEQEVVNARTIADAQAKVTIAEASVKEAEAFKKSEILRGEGEAGRKSLVMAADGALEMKLDAIVRINELYASAIEKAQPGAWSPSIVMGGSSLGNAGTNATNLVDLMTAKTAKELGVDLSVRSNSKK